MTKPRGFTIVELLIVIVVIAILAAISFVAFNGIQSRAKLSSTQAALNQVHKSIELSKIELDTYPTSIQSCATPTQGATCIQLPSGFTSIYTALSAGARSAPVSTGITTQPGYELTMYSNSASFYKSNTERTSNAEFMQYANLAPIIDQRGLRPYRISFDIKSANTSTQNTMLVYLQNGSGAKYYFGVYVPVTTSYTRQNITVTPTTSDSNQTAAVLAFYGVYNSGNIPSVMNVEVIEL